MTPEELEGILKDDIKTLQELGFGDICLVKSIKQGNLIPSHITFSVWIDTHPLQMKLYHSGNTYKLYHKDKLLRKEIQLSELSNIIDEYSLKFVDNTRGDYFSDSNMKYILILK